MIRLVRNPRLLNLVTAVHKQSINCAFTKTVNPKYHTFAKLPATPGLLHTLRPRNIAAMASAGLNIEPVDIENPNELNFILGHAHFIQTADDIAEILARHGVSKFGVAFCEASEGHPAMPGRRVRFEGNDDDLAQLAARNALKLGAGHSFIAFMDGAFPISVLNSVKMAPTVCRIYCATANPTTVLVVKQGDDRKGIIGVIDGLVSTQLEDDSDKTKRKDFLRMIGYKR